jgi:hypothetical protein
MGTVGSPVTAASLALRKGDGQRVPITAGDLESPSDTLEIATSKTVFFSLVRTFVPLRLVCNVDLVPAGYTKSAAAQPQLKMGYLVSGNFFQVLGVEPQLGRSFRPDDDVLLLQARLPIDDDRNWGVGHRIFWDQKTLAIAEHSECVERSLVAIDNVAESRGEQKHGRSRVQF